MNQSYRVLRWLALTGILIAVVLLALSIGSTNHDPTRIFALLAGDGSATEVDAILGVRLPRVLVGLGAGIALAVAGTLLQCVTRNPLADSGLLGINAGGGLAVVAVLATYPERSAAPAWLLPVAAACGGLCAAMLVISLSWRAGVLAPFRLLLVGLAIAATAGAIMLSISLGLDGNLLRYVIAWQAGTFSGRDFSAVAIVLPSAVIGGIVAWILAPWLDLLALGDDAATGLGLRTEFTRTMAVILAALLASSSVTVSGSLSFIGLLAPALARAVVGSGMRSQVPAAALIGAAIVILADALARTVAAPIELPTGILIGLVGGPALLITLIRWSRS